MLEAGRRLKQLPGFPRLEMGRADQFFERRERRLEDRNDVPVWDSELLSGVPPGHVHRSGAPEAAQHALAATLSCGGALRRLRSELGREGVSSRRPGRLIL